MTNLICSRCKSENTDYFLCVGFLGCYCCGYTWGGSLQGKNLNPARLELGWIKLSGTEEEKQDAFRIGLNHLEAIAKAIECNLTLKLDPPNLLFATKLPSDCHWWIENRNDIENKLLEIGGSLQSLPK
jgi:hypothetical protein